MRNLYIFLYTLSYCMSCRQCDMKTLIIFGISLHFFIKTKGMPYAKIKKSHSLRRTATRLGEEYEKQKFFISYISYYDFCREKLLQ